MRPSAASASTMKQLIHAAGTTHASFGLWSPSALPSLPSPMPGRKWYQVNPLIIGATAREATLLSSSVIIRPSREWGAKGGSSL